MECLEYIKAFAIPGVTLLGIIVAACFTIRELRNTRKIHAQNVLKDHYRHFWDNEDMATVRGWLACDRAYEKLRPILETRMNPELRNTLDAEDYLKLDKVDKFINTVMLIVRLNLDHKNDEENEKLLWEELHLHYWISAPYIYNRRCFIKYIYICYRESFYEEMKSIGEKKMKAFDEDRLGYFQGTSQEESNCEIPEN